MEYEFLKFYSNILSYIENKFVFGLDNIFYKLSNLQLLECIDYTRLIDLINQFPSLNIDPDMLFNEISIINNHLTNINPSLSTKEKYELLLKPNIEYSNFTKVIGYFLCVPISNAHVERAFSMLKKAWGSERCNLSIDALESELLIKYNFKMECIELYDLL